MEMSMDILAKYIVNALELKDNELLNVLLKEYEEVFPQEKRAWWGNDTYKHVITTIMARVNTPFYSKNSLSAMATNIPLLIGIYLSINDNDDNTEIQKWNNLKNKHKQLQEKDDKNNNVKTLRNLIKDAIRKNEDGFLEQDKDMNPNINVEIINSLNEVFYTYYGSENKYNTDYTYDNVKEVIVFFTNYYNLVNYLLKNAKLQDNYILIYPDLDKDKKNIELYETDNIEELCKKINSFIEESRKHFYPLLKDENEEK